MGIDKLRNFIIFYILRIISEKVTCIWIFQKLLFFCKNQKDNDEKNTFLNF